MILRILVALLATISAGGCADALVLQNRSGSEVGVLVSGKDAGGEFHHRGYRTTGANLTVGRLEASSTTHEAIGFSIDRPPTSLSTPWTRRVDRFTLGFRPRIGIQVIEATAGPKAADHFVFPNGDLGDSVWKPLRDDIGFVPGRLNIYWVDTVNGGTTNGWSNFGTQIAMGRLRGGAVPRLLPG